MQILVLGMHDSGASAVTRLLNMMGACVGTEESVVGANSENLDGLRERNREVFWERKDVVDLNEEVLGSLGLAWNRALAFNPSTLKSEDLDWARKRIRTILATLEPSRPWVVKDPRLCLTLPLWLEQLEVPVAVIVWRNPVEVAESLKLRRVTGAFRLMSREPRYPYDLAKPLFAAARDIQKEGIDRSLDEARAVAPLSSRKPTSTPTPRKTNRACAPRNAPSSSERKRAPCVDVVVTIHNALDNVRLCLESVVTNTVNRYAIIAVNDGSDPETKAYLEVFESVHAQCKVIHNEAARGYTVAANQGLRASTADYAILLNSDTIVPKGWLDALLDCAQSDPKIGIVGPMSNAASYQSLPKRRSANGDWAVNALPPGFTVDDMASLVSALSRSEFPRVPFVNGFCYMIKHSVIDAIGYLDEETFPHGYGEENDYSLRAAAAGFELVIADQSYVFHEKSKSFGHERRLELTREGQEALTKKHSAERLAEGVLAMEDTEALADLAERVGKIIENGDYRNLLKNGAHAREGFQEQGEDD